MSIGRIEPPRDAGIEGVEAWSRSLAEGNSIWLDAGSGASVQERLARGLAMASFEPKFRLRRDDVFFCIGSCFVRAIEECLLCRDLEVSSIGIRVPLDEAPQRLNGFLNKFTTASMENELLWSLAGVAFPDEALVHDGTGYHDLQLAYQLVPAPIERARERRAEIEAYFGRLRDASVVIFTLGIVEVWYDGLTGLYLNVTPNREMVERHPGRFTVHRTDYAENRARLEAVYAILTRYGRSDVKLIVTVSPVPLHRTFTAPDALIANGYGKSTLRAVAGDFVRDKPNAEYYPSYEIVTVSDRCLAYERDELHVEHGVVDAITADFLTRFGIGAEAPNTAFREGMYLKANLDVRAAVAEQRFRSGYEHWLRYGRSEGRPLRA
jgi:GSCFA family